MNIFARHPIATAVVVGGISGGFALGELWLDYQSGEVETPVLEWLEVATAFIFWGLLTWVALSLVVTRRAKLQGELQRAQAKHWQSLGWLSSAIVHEVRSPLSNLVLIVDELDMLTAEAAPEVRHLLQRVRINCQRIQGTVAMVYGLARSDAGPEDDAAPIPARTLIIRALERIEPDLRQRVRIAAPGDGAPVAHAESSAIILSNLLRNALRHGGDGPIDVVASECRPLVDISVSNAGALPDGFHLGSDGAEATAPIPPTGLGLGLLICNEVARRIGSPLEVSQSAGTVTFTLRCRHAAAT